MSPFFADAELQKLMTHIGLIYIWFREEYPKGSFRGRPIVRQKNNKTELSMVQCVVVKIQKSKFNIAHEMCQVHKVLRVNSS